MKGKTSEVQEFRVNCRKFLDEMIREIVCHRSVSSGVSRGLFCFGPEILLDGDSDSIFGLFAGLCKILVDCGVLLLGSSSAAVDEFYSYVVEKRRQYAGSDRSGSAVFDVMAFLLGDYSFQSRHNVLWIFKLCCLIVSSGRSRYPSVLFELPGSALDQKAVDDCVRMVQSYVLSPGYAPKLFFTDLTLDAVRSAVEDASVFYVTGDFDVWKNVCSSDFAAFVSAVSASFSKMLSRRREAEEKDILSGIGLIGRLRLTVELALVVMRVAGVLWLSLRRQRQVGQKEVEGPALKADHQKLAIKRNRPRMMLIGVFIITSIDHLVTEVVLFRLCNFLIFRHLLLCSCHYCILV